MRPAPRMVFMPRLGFTRRGTGSEMANQKLYSGYLGSQCAYEMFYWRKDSLACI